MQFYSQFNRCLNLLKKGLLTREKFYNIILARKRKKEPSKKLGLDKFYEYGIMEIDM